MYPFSINCITHRVSNFVACRRPSGERHHMTLLDGEMVVDEDNASGTCRRRYLAYDLMVLNQNVVAGRPFKVLVHLFMQWRGQPAAEL